MVWDINWWWLDRHHMLITMKTSVFLQKKTNVLQGLRDTVLQSYTLLEVYMRKQHILWSLQEVIPVLAAAKWFATHKLLFGKGCTFPSGPFQTILSGSMLVIVDIARDWIGESNWWTFFQRCKKKTWIKKHMTHKYLENIRHIDK